MAEARFKFGANWARFLRMLDDERIAIAEHALQEMLGVQRLDGLRFVDIGSGSGLSSLAARRLGARVHSFDYDAQSVACTQTLRDRYFGDDPAWRVERGSVLDRSYLDSLGRFDVVYSWGVLHHTGRMWDALENVSGLVAEHGVLFVALYADQGAKSRFWWWVKRTFVALPRPLRVPWAVIVVAPFEVRLFLKLAFTGHWKRWVDSWLHYKTARGMSRWYDLIDWVGGFPFEVARPVDVEAFYHERGFVARTVRPSGGAGCVEYVFDRKA